MFRSLFSFFGSLGGTQDDESEPETQSEIVPEPQLQDLSDDELLDQYHRAGLVYGEAMDEHHISGMPEEEDLHRWRDLEEEVARRNYRTLSIDAFMGWAGWGREPQDLGVKCEQGEEPVRHSLILIEHLLPELESVHTNFLQQVMESEDGGVFGEVLMPSTEGWIKDEDDRGA